MHAAGAAIGPRFLRRDGDGVGSRRRVVGPNLGTDAVFERRNDFAARRVVFRIGREHQHDVELQANRVALHLNIALLQDVEEPHLNLAGQIGQFVDGEDAAIGARQQAIVHGQFVGQVQSRLCRLDRIDVADDVGDGDVGRGQLLDVARLAGEPRERHLVALARDPRAAGAADRIQRIVVNLAAGHDRNLFVEQIDQRAEDAALGLTAQAEQDEVVAREDRIDQLRDDRFVVADDAREQRFARLQLAHEVVADFLFDGAGLRTDALAQFAERLGKCGHGFDSIRTRLALL